MRLCSAYIPDVDRITVCMIQNKSQLSPECRAHFRPEPAAAAAPVAAAGRPLSIRPTTARKPVSVVKRKPKKPAKPAAT
jgi:pantothenate kinase